MERRVGRVEGRGEGLDGPEVQDGIHRGGEELGRGGAEGEGGDGVGVGAEGVGDGVLGEGEDVDVVVDAADEDGLPVFGPLDL